MAGPRPPDPATGRRVLIVTASMGAGHNQASAEFARRLGASGEDVRVVDLLTLTSGGQGRRLQRTYAALLRYAPWVYDTAMRCWARWPGPFERLTAVGAGAFERALLGQVDDFEPDVVVSTYNLASQCLGRLRRRGRLRVPVVTYVVDPGAHPYWVSDAVDMHLAMTPLAASELRRLGAPGVVLVDAVVRPEFSAPRDRNVARRLLGLDPEALVVVINAGSWAVGGMLDTLQLFRSAQDIVAVALCGRDEALRRRLTARGLGKPMGWVEDMAALLAAADVLVDNAGGTTCSEALASGLPVVLFRPLPGHGRINATTLERSGLVRYVRSDADLLPAVRAAAAVRSTAVRSGAVPAESGPWPPTPRLRADAVQSVLAWVAGPGLTRAPA